MTSISAANATDINGMSNNSEELYPLALLMEELKHDDTANRVEAMKRLGIIALVLGPERTRDELVPFLTEVAQDDEDEVFSVLAVELGKFVPYVGGPEYANYLLPALEILASTEETIVREEAVKSLNTVAEQLLYEQLFHDFIPLLEHLATADWFSAKVSSCGIFKSVIYRVEDDIMRKNLLALYLQLIQDETPMVRRAAANHLSALVDTLKENVDLTTDEDWDYISTMFQKVTTDAQDSVRFLGVNALISISEFFNKKGDDSHTQDLFESAQKLISDEAWRVRYAIADKFEKLTIQFIDNDENVTQLLKPFLVLCEDNESDVRTAIAKQIPSFAEHLNDKKVILAEILPTVQNLSMDENETVRASLALTVTNLVLLLDKEDVTDNLLPIFLNMMKDESPDVRLNIIANLKVVNDVVGIATLSESLLPAVSELAKDMNWRIRMAIIEYIPILGKQLGVEIFDNQLTDLSLSWLWDTVYSIREAAIQNIKKLTEIFGSNWSRDEIVERLLNFDSELMENFVYRFTVLSALTALVPVVNHDVITALILPFILPLTEDAVPNIRFNVAKSLAVIAAALEEKKGPIDLITSQLIPSLQTLAQDEDFDVTYFATQSLEECQALLE